MTTKQDDVTQADRDAASGFRAKWGIGAQLTIAERKALAQDFASHRIKSEKTATIFAQAEITQLRTYTRQLEAKNAELVEALKAIESLCQDEIDVRFHKGQNKSASESAKRKSRVYALLVMPRNIARQTLAKHRQSQENERG